MPHQVLPEPVTVSEPRRSRLFRWCCSRRRSDDTTDLLNSRVDPALRDDSETDVLIAGVAQLIYRHIAASEAVPSHVAAITPAVASNCSRTGRHTSLTSAGGTCTDLTSADFDEVLFLVPLRWRCCCPKRRTARRRPQRGQCHLVVEEIFSLLCRLAETSESKKEVVVLTAIYLERLLARHTALRLTIRNWRPLVVAAIHLACKTWEDVHPWNAEYADFLSSTAGICYSAQNLHLLELRFLAGLEYRMEVCGELYASYYFALLEADRTTDDAKHYPVASNSVQVHRAHSVDCVAWAAHLPPHARDRRLWGIPDHDTTPPSTASSSPSHRDLFHGTNPSGVSRASEFQSTKSTSFQAVSSTEEAHGQSAATDEYHRLDPANPYVGIFRHAPRASPPSTFMTGRSGSGTRHVSRRLTTTH